MFLFEFLFANLPGLSRFAAAVWHSVVPTQSQYRCRASGARPNRWTPGPVFLRIPGDLGKSAGMEVVVDVGSTMLQADDVKYCRILSDADHILTFWKSPTVCKLNSYCTELGLDGFNCLLVAIVGWPHLAKYQTVLFTIILSHTVIVSCHSEIAVPALVVTNTSSRLTRPSAKAADNARPMPSSFPQIGQRIAEN